MQTGGGPPKKFDIPTHAQIILQGCSDKPRFHRLEKPMEVCGTYGSDQVDGLFGSVKWLSEFCRGNG